MQPLQHASFGIQRSEYPRAATLALLILSDSMVGTCQSQALLLLPVAHSGKHLAPADLCWSAFSHAIGLVSLNSQKL